MSPAVRRALANVLRIALTAGFIAWVISLIELNDTEIAKLQDGKTVTVTDANRATLPEGTVIERREGFLTIFRRMDRSLAAGMACLVLVPTVLAAFRWWLLMRASGISIPFRRVFFVSYAGAFFNLVFPGVVGGDIPKAMLAAKGETRKAAIVGTIMLDRIIGLAGMVLMAAMAVVPQLDNAALRQPVMAIMILLGCGVVGYLLYFNPRLRQTRLAGRVSTVLPFRGVVSEIDGVFRSIQGDRRTLVISLGITLVSQSVLITLVYGLARSIGISTVPVSQFFLFEPILFIISALPVSLGGWGIGEFAYAKLFGLAGVPASQAIALSVLLKLAMMAASLPGGLAFGLGWTKRSAAQSDAGGLEGAGR